MRDLFTLEKLNNAFYECSRLSHWKDSTQRYKANLLLNNMELLKDLLTGNYAISPTMDFQLNERGKIRDIEAPAIRDRIVQKILCKEILIPQLSGYLIYDNYASLKDRGTSLARKRILVMMEKYIRECGPDGYILKIDIRKYFESIDHEILKTMVHNKLDCSGEVMDLIDYIIDSSSKSDKGLNLGSEAPQIFAIFFLSKVDNYIKTVNRMKYYGRYMDDMYIISKDKEELKALLNGIVEQLKTLNLEVNSKKTQIVRLSHGFTFMQIKYKVDGNRIIRMPTHGKIARERRRLKKYKKMYDEGRMSEFDIYNCYKSWRNGLIKDCNAYKRTIQNMDKLYDKLFPEHEKHFGKTRTQIIKQSYEELAADNMLHIIPTEF